MVNVKRSPHPQSLSFSIVSRGPMGIATINFFNLWVFNHLIAANIVVPVATPSSTNRATTSHRVVNILRLTYPGIVFLRLFKNQSVAILATSSSAPGSSKRFSFSSKILSILVISEIVLKFSLILFFIICGLP